MIKIVTDSGCDITQDLAKELNVTVLPLKISFGEEEYYDGITINHKEFYNKLIESDVLPKTSLVSPSKYEEVFNDEDEFLCISVASKLSGTYQSAVIAKDDRSNIVVIDSKSVSIGQKILVEYACMLRDQNVPFDKMCEMVSKKVDDLYVIALVDTLEYLKKGGRISAAAAAIGSVLSIKPVLTIEDGEVKIIGKARGSKNATNLLREFITKAGEIDFSLPLSLAYSGLSDAMLVKYINDSADLWQGKVDSLDITVIGSAIGTHAGPGAIAVAFFKK